MEKTFERDVLDRLTIIETKLDDYNSIKNKVDENNSMTKINRKDIDEINDKIKWLTRTITGAIITAIIGLIITYIKVVGK